jgi:chromosome segregation ATPase
MQREVVELNDTEIAAIPQDKRVRIVQAQIEGGRAELTELYGKLENQKVQNSELEFRIRELHTELVDTRKRLHGRQKSNDKLSEQLRELRSEIAQQETKLRSIGGDSQVQSGRDADVDRLAAQLERENANVLKLQATLESRRNELATIDAQYREDAAERTFELNQLSQERRKLLDLISLELQKVTQLKQRNGSAVRGLAAHALDAQLTAALESMGSVQ